MSIVRERVVVACFGVAVLLAPRLAAAAPPLAPDPDAVAFFDEGRRLMGEGKFADAIPKFEESLRHARTVGALLNLGRCYEETGRAASAWATYRGAAALARELHDGREEAANRFAAAVRGKVSTLTLDARAVEDVDGVEVTRDGVAVGAAARGEAMPVDPGAHVVEVRAPGKRPWRGAIDVAGNGASATLRVPPLEDAAASAGDGAAAPSSGARTIGFVALGAGGLGLAFGAVAGLVAMGQHQDAIAACPSYPDHCPADGSADGPNRASKSWATASTIAFVAGGAAAIGGLTLVLTAPRAQPAVGVRVSPMLVGRGGGVGIGAAW